MGEVELISRGDAAHLLIEKYGLGPTIARRVLDIANQFGRKAEPCAGGFVHVVYRGWSDRWPYTERFQVFDHTSPSPRKVALTRGRVYTSGKPQHPIDHMKETIMPARPRRAAPAPEPEEVEEEELDLTPYLTKPHTPTMADYVEWFTANVGDPDQLESDRLIVLGARLYNIFQKSEFNISRREERRAERATKVSARAAANGAEDEEDDAEEAAPPRRAGGRKPAAAAAAAPARRATKAPAAAAAPVKSAGRPRRKTAAAQY